MRIAILILLLFLSACTAATTSVSNHTIIDEVSRLSTLAGKSSLTAEDFDALQQMVKGDDTAEHEVEEAMTMVEYDEQEHAGHALGFLASYLQTGKEVLCPGHELAHYYLHMEHGNEHDAEHALEEAKEQMPQWTVAAKQYDAEFPGAESYETTLSRLESHLERIEGGQPATGEEIRQLATSTCVEADDE